MIYHMIAFSNTHTAMEAKAYLRGKINFQVMPTLRELSESCGISLRVPDIPAVDIKKAMEASQLDDSMYAIYYVDDSSHPPLIAKL